MVGEIVIVCVMVGDIVNVGLIVKVWLLVKVKLIVGETECVRVMVLVRVKVGVGVLVMVLVAVGLCVKLGDGIGVMVFVIVEVSVTVAVKVGVAACILHAAKIKSRKRPFMRAPLFKRCCGWFNNGNVGHGCRSLYHNCLAERRANSPRRAYG